MNVVLSQVPATRRQRFGTVMLFSERLSEQEMLEAAGANRPILLDGLLNDFRKAFPNLTFELRLDFSIINAQAFALGDKRVVALYRGYVFRVKTHRTTQPVRLADVPS